MGRHNGDCCFEIAACKSSQASVVWCMCGGTITGTVVLRRGSNFWGVGHRSVTNWAWFTASDAMLVLAASGTELPVSEWFVSGLRARCNTLKYSGLDHSEMHSLGTETQYTDFRIRRYKFIEMILPKDAICSWVRVSEEASSYKNALAVGATAIAQRISVIRTDYRVVIVNWLLPCGVIVTLSHWCRR